MNYYYKKRVCNCMKMPRDPGCNVVRSPSQSCSGSNTPQKLLEESPQSKAAKKPWRCLSKEPIEQQHGISQIKTCNDTAELLVVQTDNGHESKRRCGRKKKGDSGISESLNKDTQGALLSTVLSNGHLESTPKRKRGRPRLKSITQTLFTTPVSPLGTPQDKLVNTTVHTESEPPQLHQLHNKQVSRSHISKQATVGGTACHRPYRKREPKKKVQACSKNKVSSARHRHSKAGHVEEADVQLDTQPPQRIRPKFELQELDLLEQDETSSELSIDLNQNEDKLAFSFLEEEDEEEEEEELPSFSAQMSKKPAAITEGVFVWCKFRNYPFWPAMVKNINRKTKKASIVFVDSPVIEKKRKGFTVALKTLKPFDCEESNNLETIAKEKYSALVGWSLEVMTDYRFRIACGSFTGSFIDYLAHDMSYPVRRNYPQGESERLTIPSMVEHEEQSNSINEDFDEQKEVVTTNPRRLLPDRTYVAHNRANEKLVQFIVKQRKAEQHLLAIMSGQQPSKWLHFFLSDSQRQVVDIYLEDDEQMDKVYGYLKELFETATVSSMAVFKPSDPVCFVLDVLLPEAIIYAIAGVDNLSIKKAEEKYLEGRSISKRERQAFDRMIEQQMVNT